jgi:putative sigma-54 modulation protein
MMEILVRNAAGNLTEKDRDYAAKKLGKLNRYFQTASKVELVHTLEKQNRHDAHRVEITVHADGIFIRGEEHDVSLRAAIDKVAEKMEQRLRRFKGRLIDRHRRKGGAIPPALEEEHHEPTMENLSAHVEIAETKAFQLKPMTVDEAALQLEMLDHPFFVFHNEQSGAFEVLYRRRDGKYGLLQPKA